MATFYSPIAGDMVQINYLMVVIGVVATLCNYQWDYHATLCLLQLHVLWHLSKATGVKTSCRCPL